MINVTDLKIKFKFDEFLEILNEKDITEMVMRGNPNEYIYLIITGNLFKKLEFFTINNKPIEMLEMCNVRKLTGECVIKRPFKGDKIKNLSNSNLKYPIEFKERYV